MEKTFTVLNDLVDGGIIGSIRSSGAMGAMFYAEPVSTFDLDIFRCSSALDFRINTLTPLYEHLSRLGYIADGECIIIEGVPVQFLPAL